MILFLTNFLIGDDNINLIMPKKKRLILELYNMF